MPPPLACSPPLSQCQPSNPALGKGCPPASQRTADILRIVDVRQIDQQPLLEHACRIDFVEVEQIRDGLVRTL
jgi:hypothetical protein